LRTGTRAMGKAGMMGKREVGAYAVLLLETKNEVIARRMIEILRLGFEAGERKGLNPREIALRLSMKQRTVERYQSRARAALSKHPGVDLSEIFEPVAVF